MPAIKVLGSMSFANRASLCSVERKLVSCIVWRAGRNSSEIKIWELQSSRAWDELCINVMWFEEGDYRNLHLYYKSVSEGISKFVGIRIHLYQYIKISNFFVYPWKQTWPIEKPCFCFFWKPKSLLL